MIVTAETAGDVIVSMATCCSMKKPDSLQRAKFPHFGSKFRFCGRTQHEAQGADTRRERTLPKINRKASTRFIGAKEQGYNVGSEYTLWSALCFALWYVLSFAICSTEGELLRCVWCSEMFKLLECVYSSIMYFAKLVDICLSHHKQRDFRKNCFTLYDYWCIVSQWMLSCVLHCMTIGVLSACGCCPVLYAT